jgi:hypothetical protein
LVIREAFPVSLRSYKISLVVSRKLNRVQELAHFLPLTLLLVQIELNWRTFHAIPNFHVPNHTVRRLLHYRRVVHTPHRQACDRSPAAHTRYLIDAGKNRNYTSPGRRIPHLAVVAQATVGYSSSAHKNIAVHVFVTPASGISSY